MSYHRCAVCGGEVVEFYCSACLYKMNRDIREGNIPAGVLPRFFRLDDWQFYRLNEKAVADGKITRAEAEQKATEKTAEILERQRGALAAEETAAQARARRAAGYIY